MIAAHIYLRKKTANTPTDILISLNHHEGKVVETTGIKIHPKDFDFKKRCIKSISMPRIIINEEVKHKINTNNEIVSEVSNYIESLKKFINENKILRRQSLISSIKNYKNGIDNNRQFIDALYIQAIEYSQRGNKIEDIIQFIINYCTKKSVENEISIFTFIENYIKGCSEGKILFENKIISKRTIQRYQTCYNILVDFANKYNYQLTFNNLDGEKLRQLMNYVTFDKKHSQNTINKYISTLKTFLQKAYEEKITQSRVFEHKALSVSREDSDNIAITKSELVAIENITLPPRLERVRDLFLIGCYTGLRFSDFSKITQKTVQNNNNNYLIELIQFKAKKRVIIPIDEKCVKLLEKYNFNIETISNQKFNKYLKEITSSIEELKRPFIKQITREGKKTQITLERWELVTAHTARRTFATHAYEAGVPYITIMQITGHRTEKSFLKYIKTAAETHAEILRRKIHNSTQN